MNGHTSPHYGRNPNSEVLLVFDSTHTFLPQRGQGFGSEKRTGKAASSNRGTAATLRQWPPGIQRHHQSMFRWRSYSSARATHYVPWTLAFAQRGVSLNPPVHPSDAHIAHGQDNIVIAPHLNFGYGILVPEELRRYPFHQQATQYQRLAHLLN